MGKWLFMGVKWVMGRRIRVGEYEYLRVKRESVYINIRE
tara:strand:+ start:1546 stop:1662 length:117 start_codon:yes stop_codon:yes gene_type:complete